MSQHIVKGGMIEWKPVEGSLFYQEISKANETFGWNSLVLTVEMVSNLLLEWIIYYLLSLNVFIDVVIFCMVAFCSCYIYIIFYRKMQELIRRSFSCYLTKVHHRIALFHEYQLFQNR